MKSSILNIFLSLILGTTLAHGATLIVTPGENLQTAFNSANSNDHVKILPGTFTGQYQIVDKNLTISKSGGTPNLTKLTLDGGAVTLIGLQIGQLLSSDSSEQNGDHLVHQCEIGNIESNTSSLSSVFDVGNMIIYKKATVTACTFDGTGGGGVGIKVSGAGADAKVQNSVIRNYSLSTASPITDSCIGVLVSNGATTNIQNNIIHSCNDRNYDGTEVDSGIGISVRNGASAKISANIIWDCFISYRFGHSGNSTGDALAHLSATTLGSHNLLWSKVDNSPPKMNNHIWNINNLTRGDGSLVAPSYPTLNSWTGKMGIIDCSPLPLPSMPGRPIRSTMTAMVPVMTLACLAGTILFLMVGPRINRSCSIWTSPRLPCPQVVS